MASNDVQKLDLGEEDLDDLDDILDEFESTPVKRNDLKGGDEARTAPVAEGTSKAVPEMENEFASQLQAGMADLMKELETSPEARQQFEGLVQEISQATSSGQTNSRQPATHERKNFQDTITETMERMKESGREAEEAALSDGDANPFLAEMLRQLETAAGGSGDDADFSNLLMGMMDQLTGKEILYEPMKDLNDKFPGWLLKNEPSLSKEDLDKFRRQHRYVREIVIKFEEPNYSDDDDISRQYIVERMQKMQELGSPPAEIMSDLANGMEMDENGMPKLPPEFDGNCSIS